MIDVGAQWSLVLELRLKGLKLFAANDPECLLEADFRDDRSNFGKNVLNLFARLNIYVSLYSIVK